MEKGAVFALLSLVFVIPLALLFLGENMNCSPPQILQTYFMYLYYFFNFLAMFFIIMTFKNERIAYGFIIFLLLFATNVAIYFIYEVC